MKKVVRNVMDAVTLNVNNSAMNTYTKTGDRGLTTIYGGIKTLKSDLQIEAYGSIDELSSFIGIIIFKIKRKETKKLFTDIQRDLSEIMTVLAGKNKDLLYLEKKISEIEKIIDRLSIKLPLLNNFILPQGSSLTCWLHILRTVCRRAERNTVRFFSKNSLTIKQDNNKIIIQYLNRLSDLFFIMARCYNQKTEITV